MERSAYLIMQESLLHAVIGTNILKNIPSKLLIELPSDENHENCGKGNDGRNGDQKRLDIAPELIGGNVAVEGSVGSKNHNCFLDLVDLNGRVDHQGEVGNADSNDLNRVLHPQSIPHNHQNI